MHGCQPIRGLETRSKYDKILIAWYDLQHCRIVALVWINATILQCRMPYHAISIYCFHPYLVCGLARVPVSTRPTRQQIRLIDNLDSGRVDNIPDIPQLSTNEKAGVGRLAAASGRMKDYCM